MNQMTFAIVVAIVLERERRLLSPLRWYGSRREECNRIAITRLHPSNQKGLLPSRLSRR